MSVDVGSKVKANQQVLLLTEDFDTVPDMYGWTKKMLTSLENGLELRLPIKVVEESNQTKCQNEHLTQ